jgi:hypothetical protein
MKMVLSWFYVYVIECLFFFFKYVLGLCQMFVYFRHVGTMLCGIIKF